MEKKEIIEKGNISIGKEIQLAKQIILSEIGNEKDQAEMLKVQFERQLQETNGFVNMFFENNYEVLDEEGFFPRLLQECAEYKTIQEKKGNNTETSLEEHLDVIHINLLFSCKYEMQTQFFNYLMECIEQGKLSNSGDIKDLVDQMIINFESLTAFRNFFSGNNLEIVMDKDELDMLDNKKFIGTYIKMSLVHNSFYHSMYLIRGLSKKEDNNLEIDNFISYLTFYYASIFSLIKKNGLEDYSYDEIDEVLTDIKNTLIKCDAKKEDLYKFDSVVKNAFDLSNKLEKSINKIV